MRAIGFLVVLTIVGFGIYMIVSPPNPRGPSGEDVKHATEEALHTAKDFTKGKVDQLKEDTKENYQAAKSNIKKALGFEFSYDQRESYRKVLEGQLDDWSQKCRELENKLSQEGQKEDYSSMIESLKSTHQELSKKINEIPSISQEKWSEFQSEVTEKMSSLESHYNDFFDKAARTGR